MSKLSQLTTFSAVLNYVDEFPERGFPLQYIRTRNEIDFKLLFTNHHLIFEHFEFLEDHYSHDLKWCNFVYDTIAKILKQNPDVIVKLTDLIQNKKIKFDSTILSIDLSATRIKNIEDFQIITSRRGEKTISYDYNEIENELEGLYGFSFRGVYPELCSDAIGEILQEVYNITQTEIEFAKRVQPNTGNFAADLMCIFSSFIDKKLCPYIDFWHHVLDFDFDELKRGGINYMAKSLVDEWDITDIDSIHPFLLKIREIYCLECPSDDEFIPFLVDW